MEIMGIMEINGNLGELTGNILFPSININRNHKKTSMQNVFNRYFNRFICKYSRIEHVSITCFMDE